ncbi:MAG: type II secretion system secretin GspD [Polyangia bacterium]
MTTRFRRLLPNFLYGPVLGAVLGAVLAPGAALAQKTPATDPTRMIRVANPATAAPLNVQPGPTSPPPPAASPGSVVSPGAAGQAAGAGQKAADDLPLPGEKEFNECRTFPGNKKVSINLKPETELLELIGWIKAISCRPFILPANIRQSKVTIIAPQLVTANEAYRIFLSALESMGLTVQPDGKVLKIIESSRARESSIPVVAPGEVVPRAEQFVTRLLRLKNITPDEVVQVLNRLKGRDGDIMPYATTNTLVITDLASNIRRMEDVVRALDVPMSGEKIWVIRLRNIVATEVTQMLQQVFGVGKQAGSGQARRPPISVSSAGSDNGQPGPSNEGGDSISQIYADDRTNSIILVAAERTYQRVFALIKRLEVQSSTGPTGRIHVYALENALAEDMSQVLGGLGISVSSSGARPGQRPGARPTPQSSGGSGQGNTGIFQDEVKVTPDKATNSLVIVATNKDFLTLRDVIRRLDLPRRQVFIEATVMEVTIAKQRNLGLAYHGGYPIDIAGQQTTVIGGLESGKLNSLSPLSALALTGLVGGAIGPQFSANSIFGQGATGTGSSVLPPMFGVLIQALQTNSESNVLQVPNILTTDNEKATITVGQNLPFPSALTSSLPLGAGSAAASLTPFQSVQRQDVQLKLEITPHISAGEQVRLEIDHEVSDVFDKNYNNLGPATTKRTLKTVAVVRDQQPVVLGGIMKDRVNESVTKIPVLGDIPILGYLFKNKERSIDKQMLLIVLTPYIINDPSELSRIFERKTRERREFIESYTAFADDRDVATAIDYTRKRGALEEINRTAVEAEREMVELRAAEQSLNRDFIDAGPVELPPMPRGPAPGGAGAAPVSPGLAPKLPPPPTSGTPAAPSPPVAPQPGPGQAPG